MSRPSVGRFRVHSNQAAAIPGNLASGLRGLPASFATDSIATLASDDFHQSEEPAMPSRFLPLAALALCVSASLPAQVQAQQAVEGAVRGRIVDSVSGRPVPT